MPDPTLDRLRAADIAHGTGTAPSFARTSARLEARRPPVRRRAVPVAVAASAALAAGLVVGTGPSGPAGLPHLGALAAAAANSGSASGLFSGYVQDTRIELGGLDGGPASVSTTRESIRRISDTRFEGTIQTAAPTTDHGGVPQAPGTPGLQTDARVTTAGGITTYAWTRPYGTLFFGALKPGEQPAKVPTDPEEARRAVAAWATGEGPAGGDPALADLLREADGARDGTQLALGYAEGVLTAPRVSSDVRAAIYDALGKVPGIRVDGNATDPAGRPAAALVSETKHGPSVDRRELFVEPRTSRILGARDSSTVAPGANADRPEDQPPYGESTTESVYHYLR